MDRRPTHWHPAPPGGRPARGGGRPRAGHLIVLLFIVGGVVLVGVAAPSVRFDSVLALLGFR